ncbi:universal stress protein [Marinicella sp. S1101]|uniref:universal stress protein n=1 Tax=Marinicella marina TaxID=2996016 RepID=UPI002260CC58|nr:universal stress protein [Marinicella marina]MCX7555076.1 universal stress protein [Marinicella marina]MDJ1141384.1 universal stress protein [Marinicella marina]
MSLYQKTIVAIDPCVESSDLIEKAIAITVDKNNITLVHVMEIMCALPTAPYAPVVLDTSQIESQVKQSAINHLKALTEKHDLQADAFKILSGSTATAIKDHAEENSCDAIIIGSHGRHGLGLLLGSTASGVIHGCGCDVLVVRLKE